MAKAIKSIVNESLNPTWKGGLVAGGLSAVFVPDAMKMMQESGPAGKLFNALFWTSGPLSGAAQSNYNPNDGWFKKMFYFGVPEFVSQLIAYPLSSKFANKFLKGRGFGIQMIAQLLFASPIQFVLFEAWNRMFKNPTAGVANMEQVNNQPNNEGHQAPSTVDDSGSQSSNQSNQV